MKECVYHAFLPYIPPMPNTRTAIRWAEIVEACSVRVVAMNHMAEEEEL